LFFLKNNNLLLHPSNCLVGVLIRYGFIIEHILGIHITMEIKYKKSIQAINYFTRKSENNTINRMKLMKLLWLSDRLHLQMNGRTVLKDNYVAMKNGPVPSLAKEFSETRDHDYIAEFFYPSGDYEVSSVKESEIKYFSKSDIEVFEAVWSEFGSLNEFQLSDLSHEYPEWKQFEEDLRLNPYTRFPIDTVELFTMPTDHVKSKAIFFDVIEAGVKEESMSTYNMTTNIKKSISELSRQD